MRFEHLIQINDPRLALVDFLSRQQLWLGLVHRGRQPAGFARGLESSTVDSESRTADVTMLNRTLDFITWSAHSGVASKSYFSLSAL